MPKTVDDLKPSLRHRVIQLHAVAFGGETPCKSCKGACCLGCALSHGYIDNKDRFNELAQKYGFDVKYGFQTENGCAIPLEERSGVCVSYMCYAPPVMVAPGRWEPRPNRPLPWSDVQVEASQRIGDIFYTGKEKDDYKERVAVRLGIDHAA